MFVVTKIYLFGLCIYGIDDLRLLLQHVGDFRSRTFGVVIGVGDSSLMPIASRRNEHAVVFINL